MVNPRNLSFVEKEIRNNNTSKTSAYVYCVKNLVKDWWQQDWWQQDRAYWWRQL